MAFWAEGEHIGKLRIGAMLSGTSEDSLYALALPMKPVPCFPTKKSPLKQHHGYGNQETLA